MPNSPSTPDAYSLEKLLSLIAESSAYAQLPDQEKAKIQEHIKLNNKSVLIYIYQKLSEEKASHEINRDNLAKKIITIRPSEQQNLRDDLSKI